MKKQMLNDGVIILPTYNETQSIYKLLIELDLHIPLNWYLIIVDDSPTTRTEDLVKEVFGNARRDRDRFHFIKNETKSGRGFAVQRGMKYANTNFQPNFVIEMDSDGSHSVESVLKLICAPADKHFIVGSRYLPSSQIIGWSITRRVFSKIINKCLEGIFGIGLSDWTNGLRRYSKQSIEIQISHEFRNSGFITLSEQALLLHENQILPFEIPITFKERTHGTSTVTRHEIMNAAKGIVNIYLGQRRSK
jgi:dolichol-phosphate mannosyltransferase